VIEGGSIQPHRQAGSDLVGAIIDRVRARWTCGGCVLPAEARHHLEETWTLNIDTCVYFQVTSPRRLYEISNYIVARAAHHHTRQSGGRMTSSRP